MTGGYSDLLLELIGVFAEESAGGSDRFALLPSGVDSFGGFFTSEYVKVIICRKRITGC